jgi:serine/threonine protein kinase
LACRERRTTSYCIVSHQSLTIIDFGFAKKVYSSNGLKTFIGTPGYVAPCILESTGYGTQADIWSMGVIVYCMLCGYLPFQDPNRDKLFCKIRKGSYEYHEKKWKDVSPEAKSFIDRLLTVNPRERSTASEALEHPWIIRDDVIDGIMDPVSENSVTEIAEAIRGEIIDDIINPVSDNATSVPEIVELTV